MPPRCARAGLDGRFCRTGMSLSDLLTGGCRLAYKWRIGWSLAVASLTGAIATLAAAKPRPAPVPASGVGLGWGWNSENERAIPSIRVEFDEGEDLAQTARLTIDEVSDRSELMDRLNVSAFWRYTTVRYDQRRDGLPHRRSGDAGFAGTAPVFLQSAGARGDLRPQRPVASDDRVRPTPPRMEPARPAGAGLPQDRAMRTGIRHA